MCNKTGGDDIRTKILPYAAAGCTVLFWSSSFPMVRYVFNYYSPESLMLFRFLVASAVLSAYCLINKVPLPSARDLPQFAAAGFLGLFLYMWAFNTGTSLVLSGVSSFIIASSPIFTLLLSIIFLKEKANLFIWAGVIISMAGIIIIGMSQITGMQFNIGVIILLSAAVFTSIYSIIQKYIMRKYTVMQATAYSVIFGTFFMLIFLPGLSRDFNVAYIHANLMAVYLGVFPAALAYFTWGYALSKAEKTVYVTSFLYLVPFSASVIAFFWLGEQIPSAALIGGVVVITGMVLTNAVKYKTEKTDGK